MEEDVLEDLVQVKCSMCSKSIGWYRDEKTAKDALLNHLKSDHSDIYNPMKLSIERRLEM